jgi:hypothetical protein
MKEEQHKKAPGCMQYAIIFFLAWIIANAFTCCTPAKKAAAQTYSFTVVKIENQRPGKKNVYVIDSTRRGLWVMTCKCDSVKVGDQFTSILKKY